MFNVMIDWLTTFLMPLFNLNFSLTFNRKIKITCKSLYQNKRALKQHKFIFTCCYIVLIALIHILPGKSLATENSHENSHKQQIVLAPGITHLLQNVPRGFVLNGDGHRIKVREVPQGLLLIGKSEGEVDLVIGKNVIKIQVLSTAAYNSYIRIKQAISGKLGLQVTIQESKVFLSGRLLRFSDWLQIANIAKTEHIQFTLGATVDEDVQTEMERYIHQLIQQSGLSKPQLSFVPYTHMLISPDQKEELIHYQKLGNSLGIEVIIAPNSLELEPLVGIKILVTEVRRKQFQRLGIQWPSSYQAQVLPVFQATPAGLSLDALEESGMGRILASPHLLCRSGKEANFLAGGELPIKVASYKNAQVVWKKYGVLLQVKPKADQFGRMSIQLSTEVSTLDMSQTIDGIPGLLTNRIDTYFNLEKSQTIALSGLLKNESGESSQGLPFLSRIPILGALFSSQDYRDQKTELVIFVTPEILDSTQPLYKEP